GDHVGQTRARDQARAERNARVAHQPREQHRQVGEQQQQVAETRRRGIRRTRQLGAQPIVETPLARADLELDARLGHVRPSAFMNYAVSSPRLAGTNEFARSRIWSMWSRTTSSDGCTPLPACQPWHSPTKMRAKRPPPTAKISCVSGQASETR